MSTRTKIAEDDLSVTYEVRDDNGLVIGSDREFKQTPEPTPLDVLAAKVDSLTAAVIAKTAVTETDVAGLTVT